MRIRSLTFSAALLSLTVLAAGCGSDGEAGRPGKPKSPRSFKVLLVSPGKIKLAVEHNPGDWIMIGRLDGHSNYGVFCPAARSELTIAYSDGAVSADFGAQKIGPGRMSGLVLLTDRAAMKTSGDSILLGHRTVDGKDYAWGVRAIDRPDRGDQKTFK